MDLPTAESLDFPPRVNTAENDRKSDGGKQILLVEPS
jgi:hypothetical protein